MPRFLILLSLLVFPLSAFAQSTSQDPAPDTGAETAPDAAPNPDKDADPETLAEEPMSLEKLDKIVRALDPNVQTNGRMWQLSINEVPVLIITDAVNDRMRALSPVAETKDVTPEDLTRMMQANFDTALDARYAIAKDQIWSTFIHPLRPLEKDQLISGLGQVVNLAQSYGTLYSGGALSFGGGDSGALQRKLIDELLKKGQEI